ncbi:RidA family protein [Streptomyces sp. TBY4]|uniref:RidA family protein n=1 Tax=Streptomyces sp. TBY4 TaxID=2962030 RepID=UPI0020B76176|nr:RidA family protein [Streptomyces sp. TBY4]MCP3753591.1 RidA family protein [Streptomyces sp. TBY4]
MSTPEERLAEAGHTLPAIATPVAAYTPALRNGPYVFVSGQLPTVDDKLIHVGKVGAEVTPEQATEAARQCALNALAALKSAVGDLSAVKQVVKVVGYVNGDPSFTSPPAVINGASELFAAAFTGAAGIHARSAVGVAMLSQNAPVVIDVQFEV